MCFSKKSSHLPIPDPVNCNRIFISTDKKHKKINSITFFVLNLLYFTSFLSCLFLDSLIQLVKNNPYAFEEVLTIEYERYIYVIVCIWLVFYQFDILYFKSIIQNITLFKNYTNINWSFLIIFCWIFIYILICFAHFLIYCSSSKKVLFDFLLKCNKKHKIE